MFLTRALLYYVRRRHFPGKLDIGKHRLIRNVTPSVKRKFLVQLLLEQDNLDLLNNPYLTEEEEKWFSRDSCNEQDQLELELHEKRSTKMLKHRLMDDHLHHLNVTKAWE